ncbi:MAG: tRNA pseudouridine(13) synthase TruD [unclassified Hahellaceae]|nr:tRNA pseudouridine(13) synthase TruD [Hahellaceae bacterium]|tara:strand:- start:18433 stop:19560 length:1128 start_codon:yes stop_codon:yes gene_type:complete
MVKPERLASDLERIDSFLCPPKYTSPHVEARWKVMPEDFVVDECWRPETEEGEHHLLRIRKRLQNTQWVADSLATFSGVRQVDIGFFGLKDRQAVTTQWFSVYLGKREAPDWRTWELDGCEVLHIGRYPRKLRRGDHVGNDFRITLRDIPKSAPVEEAVEVALDQVRLEGFPNYFGAQRFGFDHGNLTQFELIYCQSPERSGGDTRDDPARTGKRGRARGGKGKGRRVNPMYVSAARAHLFNCLLASRQQAGVARSVIDGDEPLLAEDNAHGPIGILPGGPVRSEASSQLSASDILRQEAWGDYTGWLEALHSLGERDTPRALWMTPTDMSWHWHDGSLVVCFGLPPGAYASVALSQVAHLIQDARPRNETTSIQ